MPSNLIFWVLFVVFVLAMLALDLGVFNRKAHVVHFKEAVGWTVVWISLAGLFAVLLSQWGHLMTGDHSRPNSQLTLEFVTGYLIEESLSVDNLFVFLLIFRYFKVPSEQQHRVLFWGIIGALIMRAIFIIAGVALIRRFEWITYIFGAFLIYVGIRLFFQKEDEHQMEKNPMVRFFQKHMRLTKNYEDGKFWVMREGLRYFTPLALVLLVVEASDVIFATDSIPAILAITRDPFVVFTSNVFAILGLRSLYFALAGMMKTFHMLHYGLSVILTFIGIKMLGGHYFEIPTVAALGVIVAVLAISVAASLMFPPKTERRVTS
ncbi:MAG: TerC family protein [Terriglobia bacterium]|nr:TerC family protein [Terriglobia bacterium]